MAQYNQIGNNIILKTYTITFLPNVTIGKFSQKSSSTSISISNKYSLSLFLFFSIKNSLSSHGPLKRIKEPSLQSAF